jgi:hypothetical protein
MRDGSEPTDCTEDPWWMQLGMWITFALAVIIFLGLGQG